MADDGSTDLSLCPVRALNIYLSRSSTWPSGSVVDSQHLWRHPSKPACLTIAQLTGFFVGVVRESLKSSGLPFSMAVGPHQMRKLAASHSRLVGINEEKIKKFMGFSSLTILRKNYIASVPPLKVACVLPGGPFIPAPNNQLSDSD